MKILKLSIALPAIATVDDDSAVIHRAIVREHSLSPAQFVLAAGWQKNGDDFETGNFGRDVDLSEFYRTEQDFEAALKKGFVVSEAFIGQSDAKRILTALTKQGVAEISAQKQK